jgi:MFS family permease
LKYLLFGSLYFTEGLFTAVGFVIVPIYFVETGLSISLATFAVGIALIPSTLKFFQGAIVDYFQEYGRKRFIVFGGIIFASGFFIMGFFNPNSFLFLFISGLFLSVIGFVFLDVSADAWAIETSTNLDRGKVNGAMFTGYYSGMAVGTSTLGIIALDFGYHTAFFIVGIICFIIILFPLIIKEKIQKKKKPNIPKILIHEFKKPMTQLVSIFAVFLIVNRGMIMVLVPLFMNLILNINIAQIGLITTVFPVSCALGSMLIGSLSDIWGRKNILYISIIGSIIFSALLIFSGDWMILAILYAVIGVLQGGYATSGLAMMMDITNPKIGATQFSIFASLGNLGMTIGESISGTLVTVIGFSGAFLYSAWFFCPALLILYFIRLKPSIKLKKGKNSINKGKTDNPKRS